jgi:hypothetical protein
MSTDMMLTEGDYDPDTKTVTMSAKGREPSGKPYEAKMTTKYQGDSARVFTMLMKSDETKGEYIKVMEITYKRRPK